MKTKLKTESGKQKETHAAKAIPHSGAIGEKSARRTSSDLRPPSPQGGEGTLLVRGGEGAQNGKNGTDGTAFRRVTEKDRRVACATQSEQRKRPPLARMMKTYELL